MTVHVTEAESLQLQIEKLINSHTLHGSESLCKLLRYLGEHAIKLPGSSLKEYQIATEVFGRPSDFDPHLDSLVRVQAGRLRAKLTEYYASEGSEDPIMVEMPKGTYTLNFHHAALAAKTLLPSPEMPSPKIPDQDRRLVGVVSVLSLLLAAAVVMIGVLLFSRSRTPATSNAELPIAPALGLFWQQFVSSPEEPWIIFSNGAFVGRPETGLRYFNPDRDSRQGILDHYTGVGEVLAVYDLDKLFSQLHKEIRVKRGSLFSLDDAQDNNLIFVGSPAENLTLRDIPTTHEFVFERPTSGARKGDLALANLHPQADEPKMWFATAPGTPLTDDYAIIGLVPGINPARSVLILAGTTTIGTQAAAEFVCRPDAVEQLLLRLSISDTGKMEPFEAVLHVKVARGVPIESQLVALRKARRPG